MNGTVLHYNANNAVVGRNDLIVIDAAAECEGYCADVCVFDPFSTWKIEPAALKSQGKNTPFNGYTMQGRVRHTVVEGHVAYSI